MIVISVLKPFTLRKKVNAKLGNMWYASSDSVTVTTDVSKRGEKSCWQKP
jgi:hypothetical protein